MKTTSAAVAIEHGWKRDAKSKKHFTHKKFPMSSLIIQPSGEWEVPHKAKGKTSKTLLAFLTKFHQQTLPLAPAIERQLKGQRELEEFRSTGKQPKAAHDHNNLIPRVEHGFFLQGPVKFAVDVDDIFRTLSCGPFGVGQVRAREGILANLGERELRRWAEINELPTKPFARELLIEVLRGILQNAFYAAERDGLVPVQCETNQARRLQEFKAKFERYKATATVKAERLKASGNGQHYFQKKEEGVWSATEKLTKKLVAEMKGQQQPILDWLLKNKGTRSEIAQAVASKLTTKQKPELVVGHYLPEWKKKGLIACL